VGPFDLACGQPRRLSGGHARDPAAPRDSPDRDGLPCGFVNVGHGQNGFLTAALLGGALHLIDRRPWIAGVLIGCLAYQPQFAS
jgi:hypothetical protein